MAEFDLASEMEDLVTKNGDEVGIHSSYCVEWKLNHESCKGCKYQLGCGKAVHLMGVMLLPMMYEPKNFEDYSKMQNRIQELIEMTLNAKTVEELKGVPNS
jgi:hypothetical protein